MILLAWAVGLYAVAFGALVGLFALVDGPLGRREVQYSAGAAGVIVGLWVVATVVLRLLTGHQIV